MSSSIDDIKNINHETRDYIKTLGEKINTQKGVFTVLTTLIVHKIINPKQDVRFHQASLPNGFSGRSVDTVFITPTLKELGLASMAESGWLTRSLEQPFPYTLDYNGKISNKTVKEAFLHILDYLEKNPSKAVNILRLLLFEAIEIKKTSNVIIQPLTNSEKITIDKIIQSLHEHFNTSYKTHGGSKLPVISFYAIYLCLIKQIERYKNCELVKLGSHTASDRTSKSSGDIEILKENSVFESVEIKLDKAIDLTIVRIAIEKIHRFNPSRYYILSDKGIDKENEVEIAKLIKQTKENHGCQIIINGITATIKYYLRLINSPSEFLQIYANLIEKDTELKKIHKEKWNDLIETFLR